MAILDALAVLNRSDRYIELEDRYGAHNYHPLDVVLARGEGVWVYDVDGNRYLDCLSAYSAVNQGHCHPRILSALVEQASRLTLTSRAFRNDQLGAFYKELCAFSGYDMVLPMNTGAEAVETAIKAARKWGYTIKGVPHDKAEIVVCAGNFHGRTTTIVSFSSEPQYKADFGPFLRALSPFPSATPPPWPTPSPPTRWPFWSNPFRARVASTCRLRAIYARRLRICRQRGILMMADEIQTGLGRTGRRFACDYESVRPDVMILGKALSGGFYPVSAVLSDRDVLGRVPAWRPRLHLWGQSAWRRYRPRCARRTAGRRHDRQC